MNRHPKFFKVPYDIPYDPRIQILEDECGDGVEGLAYWVIILANLFYNEGLIDLNKRGVRSQLLKTMKTDSETLDLFLDVCVSVGFIDGELLKIGHIVSSGVCDELTYKETKSDAGKKGGRPRKKQSEKQNEKQA